MLREAVTEILNTLGYYRRKKRDLAYARKYAAEHELNDENNAPALHLIPECGWLNDPNGFIFFQGKYHLFYQYYPYAPKWGPMHWGHAASADLIHWERLPVAMAPDTLTDKGGVWSGSAIEKAGKLIAMYSGDVHKGQVQNIAESADGIDFIKYSGNPVIGGKSLPKGATIINFRDPKVWKDGDKYYAVIASKVEGSAVILLYESLDLYEWKYVSVMYDFKDTVMRECPDFFRLDGRDALLTSNKSGESYGYLGTLMDGKFIAEVSSILDYGLDFYAPQTAQDSSGRRIMAAWMQKWNRNIPSAKFGWAGMMIIPRELRVIDGKIHIEPVGEITALRREKTEYSAILAEEFIEPSNLGGVYADIIVASNLQEGQRLTLRLMLTGAGEEAEYIEVCAGGGEISLDRTRLGKRINKGRKKDNYAVMPVAVNEFRIITDRFSVEIFAGGRCLTATGYPKGQEYRLTLSGEGAPEVKIVKYNLGR